MSLIVRLTRAEVQRKGACADGLALFDAIKAGQDDVRRAEGRKPRRALRLRYTLAHQLWMATAYPAFFFWLGDVGLLPRAHGPRANLGGANLYGADLRSANLYGADLRSANLGGANLYGADLGGANLRSANLYGADLYGADLGGADLYGADLYGADLGGANLRSANLGGANLGDANLYGADLRSANLYGADLGGVRNWPTGVPMPDGWKLCSQGCCLERAS